MAGNYDGSIRINTQVNTDEMDALDKLIKKATKSASDMGDEYEELRKQGLPVDDFLALEKELEKAKEHLKDLERLKNTFKGDKTGTQFESLTDEIKEAEMAVGSLFNQYADLGEELGIIRSTESSGDWSASANETKDVLDEIQSSLNTQAELEQAQQAEEQKLLDIKKNAVVSNGDLVALLEEQLQVEQRIAELKQAGVTEGYEEYDQLSSRLSEIKDKVNESREGFTKLEKSSKKACTEISKGVKKSNGLLSTMASRFKGLALSLLIFNWIRKGFNALVSSMKEGFQNLAQYSSDYNSAMSTLKSQTAQLKNSLAAGFEPIVTTIIPYIAKLISWINTAMAALSKFLALIGNKSTYTVAKAQAIDYASTLDSAASAAEEAAGALAGFDDLNVLSSSSDSSSGSSSGGEVTGADAFEEVALTDADYAWLDKLKEKFQPVIEAVERLQAALEPLKTFAVQALLDFYNSFLVPVGNWVLGTGLPGFIDGITTMVSNIDWAKLNSALDGLWQVLAPFAINIGEGLLWFWNNVLVPLGTWTISDVLPAFLDLLTVAFGILNSVIDTLKPAFSYLWENILAPLAKWTGGVIVDVIESISSLLSRLWYEVLIPLIDWFTANIYPVIAPIIESVVQVFGTLLTAIGSIIDSVFVVLNGLIDFLSGVFTGNWELAWQGIKNMVSGIWDIICTVVTTAINAVMTIITSVLDVIKSVWNEIWTAISSFFSNLWNSIVEHITTKINTIKTTITTVLKVIKATWNLIWTGLKTTVTNIFNGIWSTIKNVINSILGGIESLANGVINGINAVIRTLNSVSFTIPDWVPEWGGKTFGLNLTELAQISIPRLATGGIVTKATTAMIGEAGREAVLPLDNNTGWMDELADKIGNQNITINFKGTMSEFVRQLKPVLDSENSRVGLNFSS